MNKTADAVIAPNPNMSFEDYYKIAEDAWEKSQKKKKRGKRVCDNCDKEALSHGKRLALLPMDFDDICPEHGGKCPRCGGDLRDTGPL